MKKFFILFTAILLVTGLSGCEKSQNSPSKPPQATKKLTIYSGITMVKPLTEIAKKFEQQHSIQIHIEQGASGYLFKTLLIEKKGDIFFPGSESYRQEKDINNVLLDRVLVGYNRLALLVAKGNPKGLTSDIHQLYNPEISVVLASPDSSAVGQSTLTALKQANICKKVFHNVTYFTADSHRLLRSIEQNYADIAINWYATSVWDKNTQSVTAIRLPKAVEQTRRLELNLLKFSENPNLARKFMAYAASNEGLRVFEKYGFLTPQERLKLTQAKKVVN